ncbi:Mur ligase family protein [Anaeromassilibacillus sp. SJQ-1]|uniref:Mur ligase family protein n=1 Tax=Anaeromassilibacillus sp. SJQ-1 TaxID=3375419 RepID=UPI0039896C5D
MLLKDLLEGLEYQATGSTEKEIADLVYDSRKVKPGCAFVCLCGANVDGHLYAKQAVEAGAVAVIAQHAVEVEGVTVVLVADTRYALAVLSAAYFGHPAKDLRVVGLTGTKGKTTTSYMIRSILEDAGIKTGLIGTIGTVIGEKIIKTENTTPESYEVQRSLREMADEGCQAAVIEACLHWVARPSCFRFYICDWIVYQSFSGSYRRK